MRSLYTIANIPRLMSVLSNRILLAIVREVPECLMHTQVLNILQVLKLWMSCLMVKSGILENSLDVMTQYEI